MKYSFKNLNKSIDRWITSKTNLAPDKDYTESFLKERYTDLVNHFEGFKNFIKNQHFQDAYHKYKIGDYNDLENIFSIDKELFRKTKEAITILEIKRKLDGSNVLLQNTNEKYKEQMKIEHLKYNSATLPKSIYKYFCSLGNQRSFVAYEGKKTYGNLLPPFTSSHIVTENNHEYNFFALEKYYEMFEYRISKGEITDEKGNILNRETVYEFLISYAKGFQKGYGDFINTISKTELFELSNKDLSYKIFSRVYVSFGAKDGNITGTRFNFHNKKTSNGYFTNGYITKEMFYETGYEGGEYFKAWELILKSPMLFKEYFDNEKTHLMNISPPEQVEQTKNENKFSPEQYLQFLFHHKGNIELYNKIKHFIIANTDFDKYELNEGVTNENVISLMVVKHLDDFVFPILEAVFLFEDQPFKCVSWAGGTLKRFEPSYSEFIKSLVLVGLNDKQRFHKDTNNLIFIRHRISEIDCSKLQSEPDILCGMFEYFTGKNHHTDLEKVIKGFATIRGILKTDSDIVRDFANKHRSEILQHFQKEIIPLIKSLPQHTETKPPLKSFPEYLLHSNPQKLADALKKKFNTEKGKLIFLMLKTLEIRNIFSFVNGEKQAVHESMRIFFNRDIGKREGTVQFKYNPLKHESDLKATLAKVDSILSALAKQ